MRGLLLYNGYPRFRDAWFATLVFPLSLFVALSFWSIYSMDRELIFPKHMEQHVPAVYNHMVSKVLGS